MSDKKTITECLIEIQKNLSVPKNRKNDFAKFNYRSAEDILEAVKPLVHEQQCVLTLSDTIEEKDDRYYVMATATISNGKYNIEVYAYAREAENKKGMDEAQITGGASSYARKYALNGLFCIDDGSHDPDGKDNTQKPETKTKTPTKLPVEATPEQLQEIKRLSIALGTDTKTIYDSMSAGKEPNFKQAIQMVVVLEDKKLKKELDTIATND